MTTRRSEVAELIDARVVRKFGGDPYAHLRGAPR
jgi:hypothetical protein